MPADQKALERAKKLIENVERNNKIEAALIARFGLAEYCRRMAMLQPAEGRI